MHFEVINGTSLIRATARVRSISVSLSPFIWRASGTRGIRVEKLHVTNRGASTITFPITFPRYWIIQLVSSWEREIHGWHQMVSTWERKRRYVFKDRDFRMRNKTCTKEPTNRLDIFFSSLKFDSRSTVPQRVTMNEQRTRETRVKKFPRALLVKIFATVLDTIGFTQGAFKFFKSVQRVQLFYRYNCYLENSRSIEFTITARGLLLANIASVILRLTADRNVYLVSSEVSLSFITGINSGVTSNKIFM